MGHTTRPFVNLSAMFRATPSAPSNPAAFLQRLFLGSTVVGIATLTLQAGQANALSTPCSFGGNVQSLPGCATGPYDSTLPSDKQITLLTTSEDGTTKGPTAGAGTIDFDWIALPPPGYQGDLWEVDVDFDADLNTPTSGTFDYKINITDPSWTFGKVRLKVDALAGNPSVIKKIFSDAGFTNEILEVTANGFVSLPTGYQTLYVRDIYNVAQGDVLGSFQNVYTQVPGPLPLVGAGTAFAFSRGLRRRLKQRRSMG